MVSVRYTACICAYDTGLLKVYHAALIKRTGCSTQYHDIMMSQPFPADWKELDEDVIIVHGILEMCITKVLTFFSGKSVVTDICDGDIVNNRKAEKAGAERKGVEKF